VTTERQKRANAANAAKSTGPRTAEGRATSAGNARKHGLNCAPPWDEVRSYLYLITGSAQIEPLVMDARTRAARDLAEAEARLARCLMAERRHLLHMAEMVAQQPLPMADDTAKDAKATEGAVALSEWGRTEFSNLKVAKKEKVKPPPDPNRPMALRQRLKTLMRYRREAEAQRCKALKRWLAIQPAGGKTNKEEFAHL
jgi:hypothetical protein